MPTAPLRLMCQRPGCKKYTSSPRGRFCGRKHKREDDNENRAATRKAELENARALLKKEGICGCVNCGPDNMCCPNWTPAGRRKFRKWKAEGKI